MKKEFSHDLIITANQRHVEKEYWKNKLAGELAKCHFHYDHLEAVLQGGEEGEISFHLGERLSSRVLQISKNSDVRTCTVLMAGVLILANRYTGLEDIILGSTVLKEDSTTRSVNTILPLRNQITGQMTFKQVLAQVKETYLRAIEHQNYPLEVLIDQLDIQNDDEKCPFFDIAVLLENINDLEDLPVVGPDVIFYFKKEADSLECRLKYQANLYYQRTMEGIARHYLNVLEGVLFNPDRPIGETELLSQEEIAELLELNQFQAKYPEQTIHSIFEAQVEKYADHVAVVLAGETLTYQELNQRANQLARSLREKGVQRGEIVGVMTERSLEMIISMLAVLKAGGGYLPLDPEYPAERIEYMLADSSTQILLTQGDLVKKVQFSGQWIDVTREESYATDGTNLEPVNFPTDLAYIIYTSGTTGKPKGAMIEHRNVVRLLINDQMLFDFTSQDVWTMFHSYCFDFSVWEMYGALLYGGQLVIVPRVVAQDPKEFLKLLKAQQVTVLNQTPKAFGNLISEEVQRTDRQLALRYVIFGGEELKPLMLKPWKDQYPKVQLINMYGITETTVHVTYKEITHTEIETNVSNIGRPIPTLSTYVLDSHLKLVPLGAVGELCVGGAGVCRGYLNRPELTATKFVENPYQPGEKLYRSGDLVRIRTNGEMEYLGRIDHQVKIRGHRIELGEIETLLLKHPQVKEAIVIARTDAEADKYLCGYLVAEQTLTTSELRNYLQEELPDYMIPAHFVQLPEMPMTVNGKIDRKALPEPTMVRPNLEIEYVEPTGETELAVAKVWMEVFKMEQIGALDNFFEIGGDSYKILLINSKLKDLYEKDIPVAKMFENPTIKQLAQYIDADKKVKETQKKQIRSIDF